VVPHIQKKDVERAKDQGLANPISAEIKLGDQLLI
jgi:hypothetical protein